MSSAIVSRVTLTEARKSSNQVCSRVPNFNQHGRVLVPFYFFPVRGAHVAPDSGATSWRRYIDECYKTKQKTGITLDTTVVRLLSHHWWRKGGATKAWTLSTLQPHASCVANYYIRVMFKSRRVSQKDDDPRKVLFRFQNEFMDQEMLRHASECFRRQKSACQRR